MDQTHTRQGVGRQQAVTQQKEPAGSSVLNEGKAAPLLPAAPTEPCQAEIKASHASLVPPPQLEKDYSFFLLLQQCGRHSEPSTYKQTQRF